METVRAVIVEDELIIAVEIEETLRSFGYEVTGLFAGAEEALAHIERKLPDIVLMDINLAGIMDGTEAAAILVRLYRMPVIFLSAYSDSETIERAKSSGPFAYLTKPFEARELHTAIELALAKHRLEENSRRQKELLSATVDIIGDSVITLDETGRIQFLNASAERRLGVVRKEVVGQSLAQLVRLEPMVETAGCRYCGNGCLDSRQNRFLPCRGAAFDPGFTGRVLRRCDRFGRSCREGAHMERCCRPVVRASRERDYRAAAVVAWM